MPLFKRVSSFNYWTVIPQKESIFDGVSFTTSPSSAVTPEVFLMEHQPIGTGTGKVAGDGQKAYFLEVPDKINAFQSHHGNTRSRTDD